jgi:hypothetical protein
VSWAVKNPKQVAWPTEMQLTPLMTASDARIVLKSEIAPVSAECTSAIRLKITIPDDYTDGFFVALFRVKTRKGIFVGPQLALFVKIND